jgi:hypothetical protein
VVASAEMLVIVLFENKTKQSLCVSAAAEENGQR